VDGLVRRPVAPTARDDLAALASWVVLAAAECATAECATAGEALVDALAMVSPRPRLAARTPVAMAGPASDREILIWSPLVMLVRPEPAAPERVT
jgi:hypothetical protein